MVAGCGEAAQWSYQLRGQHGPAHWSGECGGGAQQSPIDIPASEAVKADLGPWSLHNYDSLEAAQLLSQAEVLNNGHTLKLSPGPMGRNLPAISGEGTVNKMFNQNIMSICRRGFEEQVQLRAAAPALGQHLGGGVRAHRGRGQVPPRAPPRPLQRQVSRHWV